MVCPSCGKTVQVPHESHEGLVDPEVERAITEHANRPATSTRQTLGCSAAVFTVSVILFAIGAICMKHGAHGMAGFLWFLSFVGGVTAIHTILGKILKPGP